MSLPIHHMVASGPRPVAPFSHAVEADGWCDGADAHQSGGADAHPSIGRRHGGWWRT